MLSATLNYRVLMTYSDVKENVSDLDAQVWRDVEMKHAKVVAQSGFVDTSYYPHLHVEDRIFLHALSRGFCTLGRIEQARIELSPAQLCQTGIERELKVAIREMESDMRRIAKAVRTEIYVQLINLYGWGIRLFSWDKIGKVDYYIECIRGCGNDRLIEAMENFRHELTNPLDDTVTRYRETFDRHKDLESWNELNSLYVRNGMMAEADTLHQELLAEESYLLSDVSELAYRGCIEHAMAHGGDLKEALRYFVEAKNVFSDTDIERFLETELMARTCTFNDPQRFESERLPFLENGLLGDEEYHRMAFAAYLSNLNEEKAAEHIAYIKDHPYVIDSTTQWIFLQVDEIRYLNWTGALVLSPGARMMAISKWRVPDVLDLYGKEEWHAPLDLRMRNEFRVARSVAIDAWGLYVLDELGRLDVLGCLEHVYISHLSVLRLLDDLSYTGNGNIRMLLDRIRGSEVIEIVSAGFESQLVVRDVARYDEAASAVALGREKQCLIVLGAPQIEDNLVRRFRNDILRSNDLIEIMNDMN